MKGNLGCPCGKCGMTIDNKMLFVLESIDRELKTIGSEAIVSSGARCSEHNSQVGGVPNSPHLRGLAADVLTPNSMVRDALLAHSFKIGIKRRGIGKAFVHVDIDESLPENVTWVY